MVDVKLIQNHHHHHHQVHEITHEFVGKLALEQPVPVAVAVVMQGAEPWQQ